MAEPTPDELRAFVRPYLAAAGTGVTLAALNALTDEMVGRLGAILRAPAPRRWELPPEPGPEVTAVRDRGGRLWMRVDGGYWRCVGEPVTTWSELISIYGTLTDATGEAAVTTPASALIRSSIAALPEHQRQPWEYRATSVYMDGRSRGSLVAVPHVGPSVATNIVGPAGELAALLASPPVATALADLLDALYTALREGRDGARIDYFAEWRYLESCINGSDRPFADAVEQAITKGGQT